MRAFTRELKKNRTLFIMLIPACVLVILMCYIPMSGVIVAFKDFRYDRGIFGSEWCGLDNFKYFFQSGTGWP